jgi:hypothetical protein
VTVMQKLGLAITSVRRGGAILLWLAALLAVLAPSAAAAAVEVAFYSRELGSTFPHAFVTLKGTLDRTGEPVDTSYGFTAKAVTPAVLMGSVPGHLLVEKANYIAGSDRQFSILLNDAEYDGVLAVVERWRTAAQPSYNLNRRNCVHFVGEVAQAVGLQVGFDKKLMKKPRSFLLSVKQANADLLETRAPAAMLSAAEAR